MMSRNLNLNLQVLLIISTLVISSLLRIEARLVSDEVYKPNRPTLITRNHHIPRPIVRVGDDSNTDTEIKTGMSILESTKCGKSATETIADHKNPHLLEFPWMALLIYSDGLTKTPGCDGSLISDRYVLTTASCIRLENKTLVTVQLGEYDTLDKTDCSENGIHTGCATHIQEIAVEEAIYHKDFDPTSITFSGDIGLIRLRHKAAFRSNVMPICLPITDKSKVSDKDWLFMAGWNRENKDHKAVVPFKAVVPVIDFKTCEGIHIFIDLKEKHLCVGENNVQNSYCKGDSGTPLFNTITHGDTGKVRFVQYGIVSLYGSFCNSMLPHLYVKVQPYLTWIAGNIRR